MAKVEYKNFLLDKLELPPFTQRLPWIGGDLQTLRDTFVDEKLYLVNSESIQLKPTVEYIFF